MTDELQPVPPEEPHAADAPLAPEPGAGEPLPEEPLPEEPLATEAPSEEPQPTEPTRQPLSRHASRQRLRLVGAIIAAAVIAGIMGFMGYRTFNERLESARSIDAATGLIEQADVIVVQVDTVVRSEVTSTLAESARVAAAQVPDATSKLERAITMLEQSTQSITLDDEKRANRLLAAAEARRDMMEQAPTILRLNRAASEALVPAREGWDALIAADQKSDRAVGEYNRLTKAGVKESRRLNREVAGELAAAREKLALAEQLFPEAPFDQYLAYVDLRISLNRLSQQSDAAWLADDLKRANSIISTYNTQDASAIARAKALPETPEKTVLDVRFYSS